MPNHRVRVDLPLKVEEQINLAKAIAAKHAEFGTASPLAQLKWDRILPAITTADTAHRDAKRLQAQAESATQTRDLNMVTVQGLLRSSRDVLSGVHADEMRKLGDYGFTVSASGNRAAKDAGESPAKPTP